MPRSRTCGPPPTSGSRTMTSAVIATRGEHLVLCRISYLGPRSSDLRRFHSELLNIVEIDADERIVARVAFDLDDIDAAIRRTRCQIHRRRGSTLSGRMVRHRCRLRRAQPVRGPAVGTGLREHRSPVTGDVRGGGSGRKPPRCLGSHSGTQGLYRGCASAERPGSGRHPCRAWNHARRLRRRVARDPLFDARRRHGQPLRNL